MSLKFVLPIPSAMKSKAVIGCLAVSFIAGAQQTLAAEPPQKTPRVGPFADMLPADSKQFSEDEAKAVRATKARLEADAGKAVKRSIKGL